MTTRTPAFIEPQRTRVLYGLATDYGTPTVTGAILANEHAPELHAMDAPTAILAGSIQKITTPGRTGGPLQFVFICPSITVRP